MVLLTSLRISFSSSQALSKSSLMITTSNTPGTLPRKDNSVSCGDRLQSGIMSKQNCRETYFAPYQCALLPDVSVNCPLSLSAYPSDVFPDKDIEKRRYTRAAPSSNSAAVSAESTNLFLLCFYLTKYMCIFVKNIVLHLI